MTSPEDVSPVKPPPSFSPALPPLSASKLRFSDPPQSSPLTPTLSESVLNHSASTDLPSRTSSASPSRASSPGVRTRQSTERNSRSLNFSPLGSQGDGSDDIRSIIIRAFSPVVAVCASPDTDALVQQKGFKGGFHELIRPFGENVPGKVLIRDGVGSSRSWDDFGVRFTPLGAGSGRPGTEPPPITHLEQLLERHLQSADGPLGNWTRAGGPSGRNQSAPSPFYTLFLRRLLSSTSPTPHETFAHPVACVIAISSRTPSPLETLRQLYTYTGQGDLRPPPWVNPEYLRYYVLIHDEDRDDITQSTAIFDQMKRHFGLHCHLLRLRSIQCVVSDDDSTQVPTCEWMTPLQDLASMGEKEQLIDVEPDSLYLFESDVAAIKAFVRELVAQSLIPHMENRVAVWNDQVASKRRGLSGRFMSISRRWTGFGSGSRLSGSGSSGSNYDSLQGFYKIDAPEAILRKLADFCFMLRDWKLAASTYDLLRSDYDNDKAWRYYAGAHEMCAVSTLLNPLSSAKTKLEPIDQLLETAYYSYLTRCSDAQNALRTLILGVELLKSRGGPSAEMAAKWAIRILETSLVGSIGRILISERVSACFASKTITNGTMRLGSRRRKAGMWSVLAADLWLKLGKPNLASVCLEEADYQYGNNFNAISNISGNNVPEEARFPLPEMQEFVENLRRAVKIEYVESQRLNGQQETLNDTQLGGETEETSEKLDTRNHRRSLIGAMNNPLETIPLAQTRRTSDDGGPPPNDDFE
ncbi:hypothetical protein VTO42DRAFT_3072 [Malbranchea cinnamomea]